ncbi:MAG: YihY/virulence factor BrkB family protein [Balneolaceae bacterium]|nr:YihY/virulence factor BrkB family protein [Balneolaceae bacterium]
MIGSFFKTSYSIVYNAVLEFIDDEAITRAGALAFFGIFSIPPILIIILNGVAFFAGQQVANSEIFEQIRILWGDRLASLIQGLITSYSVEFQQEESSVRTVVGLTAFLVSSSSFFLYIQYSLNRIWDVKPKPKNTVLSLIINRLFSLGIILVLVSLILMSVLLDSFLVIMNQVMNRLLAVDQITSLLFNILGPLLSYLLVVLILAFIFKYLAAVNMKWEVAVFGSALTSLLFVIGKLLIGLMIGSANIEGTYGIVGSLILVMLWVYYSAAILYFGAELTQQYGRYRSKPIQPANGAVKITMEETSR